MRSAIGVFGAGSGFRVGWGAAGGGGLVAIFGAFLLVSPGIWFCRGEGGWALGYHSMEFRDFPYFS